MSCAARSRGVRSDSWQGSNWCRRSTREAIYIRDGHACVYCGAHRIEVTLTLDHVVPVERGGRNHHSNLVTACLSCNSARKGLTMRQWFARLRDAGIDTARVGRRMRRLRGRGIDRDAGRRAAEARRARA